MTWACSFQLCSTRMLPVNWDIKILIGLKISLKWTDRLPYHVYIVPPSRWLHWAQVPETYYSHKLLIQISHSLLRTYVAAAACQHATSVFRVSGCMIYRLNGAAVVDRMWTWFCAHAAPATLQCTLSVWRKRRTHASRKKKTYSKRKILCIPYHWVQLMEIITTEKNMELR